MANLLQEIRSTIGEQMGSYGLTDYYIGTVTKDSPLEIQISDREFLDAEDLILTEAVLEKKLNLSHLHQVLGDTEGAAGPAMHTHHIDFDSQKSLTTLITITEGLKVGDKVQMVSVSRGQQFIVLSKIREKSKVVIDKEDNWKWS